LFQGSLGPVFLQGKAVSNLFTLRGFSCLAATWQSVVALVAGMHCLTLVKKAYLLWYQRFGGVL